MVNPIVQFKDIPDFVVWGVKQSESSIPLPMNPWLRRRRLGGVKYEVERLYARCRDFNKYEEVVEFLSSEYQQNKVYYNFIHMVGIRRFLVYFGRRVETEHGRDS